MTRTAGTRRTVLLAAVAVVALLAVAAVAVVTIRSDGDAVQPPAPGGTVPLDQRVAPDTIAPLPSRTLEGFADNPPVELATYRGRPLVVNFWATWCDPCVKEMPMLNRVAQEFDGVVAFLGVDVMDAPSRARPFVDDLGVVYDLAVDREAELFTEVGGYGMPTTLFVNDQGIIVHRVTGELTAPQLRELLATELGVAVDGAAP